MITALICGLCISAHAKNCADDAKVVEPQLSDNARSIYTKKLETARKDFDSNPTADNLIWVARRQGYLGLYKEAIETLTAGIRRFPQDARMYRHRGHRNITLRCFDDAIRDLKDAERLAHRNPDEIEPDGLPNERNIPTSTLQTNIWYHLGLAEYLTGDFNRAAASFMECFKRATTPDMQVAAAHWLYMSIRRYGKKEDANEFITKQIKGDLDIIENQDYYKLVKLYKGTASGETLLNEFETAPDTLSKASLGYGLGNRWLYHGKPVEAKAIFEKIIAGKQWASFGYIAAEVDLNRMK